MHFFKLTKSILALLLSINFKSPSKNLMHMIWSWFSTSVTLIMMDCLTLKNFGLQRFRIAKLSPTQILRQFSTCSIERKVNLSMKMILNTFYQLSKNNGVLYYNPNQHVIPKLLSRLAWRNSLICLSNLAYSLIRRSPERKRLKTSQLLMRIF